MSTAERLHRLILDIPGVTALYPPDPPWQQAATGITNTLAGTGQTPDPSVAVRTDGGTTRIHARVGVDNSHPAPETARRVAAAIRHYLARTATAPRPVEVTVRISLISSGEIELIKGSRDLLNAGQDRLASAGVRASAHHSKLARALGRDPNASPETVSAPRDKGPAADVLLAYLREQLKELKDQDPGVRQDAHDAVHKMRVATRRLRSVLATYRKLLEDADSVNSLRDELRWLAGVLGEARDAEVMLARLKDMIAAEPGELVMGPVIRRIDLELGADYQKAHATVLEALDGQRYFRLLDTLESMLAAPTLTPLASKPARKVMPKLVKRAVKRLRTAVREAKRHPVGTGDHPALHEARKDGKRLRYAAEAAAPISRKKAARLADAAHGVQKVLGDHQDSIVTRDLLRRLSAEAVVQGENGFSYGRLHALEQSVALDAEARFHRQWKKFPSASL
ncbi:CHAD domain-containing protein [Arthrobacter sp. ZGTC131]|uniref:CYTH and CHAD domain-containing protein n=1 Tax=Arthrobacter sp. ZGTC131 TaxID=2058898 RepID=UPI000CE2E5B6|nr:CHAD domain-containing protein [Arthrobacter sp. ZGTC131]